MGDLFDYILEAEEKVLCKGGLTEADFLLFAQLAYLKYEGLVPSPKEHKRGITLRELACHPGKKGLFRELWFASEHEKILDSVGDSSRFGAIRVCDYAKVMDRRREAQFSAITFVTGTGENCVAFCGTDETVTGWKEDVNMVFDKEVPCRELACAYLRQAAKHHPGKLYVVGHSKGGNLAFYSTLNASEEIRQRIAGVYNFDGPGFRFPQHRERIRGGVMKKYVPPHSVVGIFYDSSKKCRVIESGAYGLMQHNAYTWKIRKGRLLPSAKKKCIHERYVHRFMRELEKSGEATREKRIDKLFSVFSYAGSDSFWKIGEEWRHRIPLIIALWREGVFFCKNCEKMRK